MTRAEIEGRQAFLDGKIREDNPFHRADVRHSLWQIGWDEASVAQALRGMGTR